MMALERAPDEGGWAPNSLAAFLICKLLQDVTSAAGSSINSLVIACPTYFGDEEKSQLEYAATLFGVSQVKVELAGVACSAYFTRQDPELDRFIAVDVGSDRSIVSAFVGPGKQPARTLHSVQVPSGILLIEQKIEADLRQSARLQGVQRGLNDTAAAAKIRRCVQNIVRSLLPGQFPIRHVTSLGGRVVSVVYSSSAALELAGQLTTAVIDAVKICLDALDDKDRFAGVIFGGAAPCVPGLKAQIAKLLPGSSRVLDLPDATAFGAATVAAAEQVEQVASLGRQGSVPCDIGMHIWNAAKGAADFETLIRRDSALPASQSTILYTRRSNQERIVLDLAQRDPDSGSISKLGSFCFGPIANPEKNYPLELSVSIDRSGFLNVIAKDPRTRKTVSRLLSDTSKPGLAHLVERRALLLQTRVNE